MLVSAAMAERPRAAASGPARTAPTARPAPAQRRRPPRVIRPRVWRRRRVCAGASCPGWFWGALGCLTVLVVGLSVVFFMGQAGPAPTPPAAAVTDRRATVAAPPVGRARPAAAAPTRPRRARHADRADGGAACRHRQAVPVRRRRSRGRDRPIKVARSPSSARQAARPRRKPAADDKRRRQPKRKSRQEPIAAPPPKTKPSDR